MNTWALGPLGDPSAPLDPVVLDPYALADARHHLRSMVRIRCVERRLAQGKRDGAIGGPVHLGVGQEAVAVGVAAELSARDRVFGAHRSHSHVLAMGADVRRLIAEVLGKNTGLARGMGGSMHLWDEATGFYGSVPIVAGTVPLAVGAALAARLQGTTAVGVAFLGDGALEEGVVHESLNLARMLRAPTLFVVENNLFASHMHISLRQPQPVTARFADANDIPYAVVDGNDVMAVRRATASLLASARAGGGPAFLEAITYRWYGHVDWREDIDVGVNRSAGDVAAWRRRDPVARLVAAMTTAGVDGAAELDAMERELTAEVDHAWDVASRDPYPAATALLDRVYAAPPRGAA